MRQPTVTGYIGIVDGRPFFDDISDSYTDASHTACVLDIYRNRSDARKRFEEVRKVELREISPRPRRKGRSK